MPPRKKPLARKGIRRQTRRMKRMIPRRMTTTSHPEEEAKKRRENRQRKTKIIALTNLVGMQQHRRQPTRQGKRMMTLCMYVNHAKEAHLPLQRQLTLRVL